MDFLLSMFGVLLFAFYLGEFFDATVEDADKGPKILIILVLSFIMLVWGISWNIFVTKSAEWQYKKTEIIHNTDQIEYEHPMRCELFIKEYPYSLKSTKYKQKCKLDK